MVVAAVDAPREEACSVRRAGPQACLPELLRVRSGRVIPGLGASGQHSAGRTGIGIQTQYLPCLGGTFGLFTLLDRVESVSLAARTLGINVQTCFHWAYKAGAVTRRPRANPAARRSTTQEQKDEFFAALARGGSVSAAARDLGLTRSQCVSWARHAGMGSAHTGVCKRAEFLRLREAGESV